MEKREVTGTTKEIEVSPETRETCRTRHEVTETQTVTETETREIEGGLKGLENEHTHMEVVEDHEGELAECFVTRCKQLDSLLWERRETLFSLEADRDQVSSVVPSEVEGASAVDRCTPSLVGMEAPGTLGGTRFPSVIAPVCVVKGVGARACVRATPGESETVCVSETLHVRVSWKGV